MANAVKCPSAWHPPSGAKLSRNQLMPLNVRQKLALFILPIPFNLQDRVEYRSVLNESLANFLPLALRCRILRTTLGVWFAAR